MVDTFADDTLEAPDAAGHGILIPSAVVGCWAAAKDGGSDLAFLHGNATKLSPALLAKRVKMERRPNGSEKHNKSSTGRRLPLDVHHHQQKQPRTEIPVDPLESPAAAEWLRNRKFMLEMKSCFVRPNPMHRLDMGYHDHNLYHGLHSGNSSHVASHRAGARVACQARRSR